MDAVGAVKSVGPRRPGAACVAVALFALSLSVHADQAVPPSALKAALLYNFTKFVQWPADAAPPQAPLALCVMGDQPVGDALTTAVRGRSADGHALVARVLAVGEASSGCHLLYVSGVGDEHASHLIDGLRGTAVFTASDLDHFAQRGGVLQFVVRDGKMRFAVNVDAVQRARLRVSSTLLGLAVIVKDGSPAASRTSD